MSQQFGADPRTVRLGSDFKEVRLLLERNPNRLFDVWCSMLTPDNSLLYLEDRMTLMQVVGDLNNFVPAEEFAQRYPARGPEQYAILYRCDTLIKDTDDEEPTRATNAIVEIVYHLEWPSEKPHFILLKNAEWGTKEIWHPNLKGAAICLKNGRPFPTGRSISEVIAVIGRLLQYQSYNLDNPLNWPAQHWATEHEESFPIDDRDLMDSTRRVTAHGGGAHDSGAALQYAHLVTILPD